MRAAAAIISDEAASKGLDNLVSGGDKKKALAVIGKTIQLCGLLGESGITSIEALNNLPINALKDIHGASIESGRLPAIYHWTLGEAVRVDDLFMSARSLDKFLTKSSEMCTKAEEITTNANNEDVATNMSNCIVALVVAFAAWKLFSTNAGIPSAQAKHMVAHTASAALCLSDPDGSPPNDVARWLGDCKTLLDLYTARELQERPDRASTPFHLGHLLEDPFFSHLVLLLALPICRTLSAAEDLVRIWDPESVREAACRLIDGFHEDNDQVPVCIQGKTLDGLKSKIMQDIETAAALEEQAALRTQQEAAAKARLDEEAKAKAQTAQAEKERKFATEQNTRRGFAKAYQVRIDGKQAAAEDLVRAARDEVDLKSTLQRHIVVDMHISENVAKYEAAVAKHAEAMRHAPENVAESAGRDARAQARSFVAPPPPKQLDVDMGFFDITEHGIGHTWPTFKEDVRSVFRMNAMAMVAIRVRPEELGLCATKLLGGDDPVDCFPAGTYELGESLGSLTNANNTFALADDDLAYPGDRTDSFIMMLFKDPTAHKIHNRTLTDHFKNMGGMMLLRDFDKSVGKGEEWMPISKLPGGPTHFSNLEINSCLLNLSGSGIKDFPLAYALTQFLWTQKHGFRYLQDDVPMQVWSPVWGKQTTPHLLHACSQLKLALCAHGPPSSPAPLTENGRSRPNDAELYLEASELYHTAVISGEMCAGMSRTESAELLQLLVQATAAHNHPPERLIAAHETEEKFRRHKDGYAGQYEFTAFASEKASTFQLEHRRAREQTTALGVVGLTIRNLSDRSGDPEKALYVCPMAKFDESDTPEKVHFFFSFFFF